MAAFAPNSELVAMTYLRSIVDPKIGVNTTLPEDLKSWADGFVQVTVVGGAPDHYIPTRTPLIQVDVWMPSINGSKPKWARTNTVAEDIFNFLYSDESAQVPLELGNYKDVLVQSAYPALEPRRVTNDPAGHARYTFDLVLTWIENDTLVA